MNTHNTPPNIKHLVERAKVLSNGRIRNAGRPKTLMSESEAKIVSAMRQQKCSTSSIFKAMQESKLTSYSNMQKFRFAYNQYKLYH